MKKIISRAALAAAAIALGVSGAHAFTTSGTLSVTAAVQSSCTVGSSAVAFGSINSTTANATPGTGAVIVTCSNSVPYTVALDGGAANATTWATNGRYMVGNTASNHLPYQLYSTGTTVWGNGTQGSTVAGTGNATAQSITVNGSIPAGTYAVDSYQDTVNITVTY